MLVSSVYKISRLKSSILVIIFFFLTLQSYYFYNIGLAPFPIIALFGIIFYSSKIRVLYHVKIFSFSLFVLFFCSTIWGFFLQLDFFYLNSILGIFLGIIILIFSTSFLSSLNIVVLHKTLGIVLFLHLFFFFIQFFMFLVLGINIDFLEFITGEQSRFEAYGAITGLIRATGVFNEPATYSYFVFTLVYLRFLIFKRIIFFDQLCLLSILFTLSLSGFFLYFFFQFYYWVLFKGNFKSILFFLLLILIFFYISEVYFGDSINLYFLSRLTDAGNDNSMNTRFSDGIMYFFNLPTYFLFFGLGMGNYTNSISTTASGWMSIITTFGVLPGTFFLYLIFKYFCYLRIKFVLLIPFFILLFSTITPMQIIFWVVLSFFVVNNPKLKIYV